MNRFMPTDISIGVRGNADSPRLRNDVNAALRALPAVSILTSPSSFLRTMRDSQFGDTMFNETLVATLALLGLCLASIGIYGAVAASVRRRTSELAVRIALGATTRDILRLVLADAARIAVIGALAGFAASVVLLPAIGQALFGITRDQTPGTMFDTRIIAPGPLIAVSFAVVTLVLMAALGPALAGTRLSPIAALKAE